MIAVDSEDVFYRYKYLPFGKDKLSLDVIKEGTIKFTCPLDFNDPFDCQPVSIVSDKIKGSDFFKNSVPSHQLPPAKRLAFENRAVRIIKSSLESGEVNRRVLENVGVLSLSKTCRNILMWSHYAEYHKGFVVGFRYEKAKIDDIFSSFDIVPLPVLYSNDRHVDNYADNSSIKIAEKALLTKSCDWSYEEEERVLNLTNGPGIHKYNHAIRLHCVIAGAKIEPENLLLLKEAVKFASDKLKKKVHLMKARLSNTSFSIDFDNK